VNPHTDKTSQQQPALGKAIRELRQERGASLKTLAGEAGITLNMLSLIERGEGNPTWATVGEIATALGLSIPELAQAAERFKAQ
jgi:XRE family transcriptional regulator, regulator of sulfur utilization